MAKNRIEYTIGFKTDTSGLDSLKRSLDEIKKLTPSEYMKINPEVDVNKARSEVGKLQHDVERLENAMKNAYNPKIKTLNLSAFKKEIDGSGRSLAVVRQELTAVGQNKALDKMVADSLKFNTELKQSSKWLDEIGQTLSSTIKWGIASRAMNEMSGSIQGAYNYVKALDSSLNDIRIVTGKSADEMARFAVEANKAAQKLGQGTKAYSDASLIYYQQGLGDDQVKARAETTLKAANVTGQDAKAVSEQLTAVWNGYKVDAAEAETYVDKLAAVASTTASNLEELSTGMSKVASAANAMGVDMDQLNAQLATVISVTRQAPETAGTAFKTIYARMSSIKAGEDEDGTTLQKYTKDMKAMGINVLDQNNHIREMGDVIEEVGNKWSTMSKEQQLFLAQTMAGTRQYNNLLALFDNWDMYTSALETSANAAGTLQKQQDTYMESTEAHLERLSAATENFQDSLLDTGAINFLADLGTDLMNLLANFTDAIGGLKGALAGLGMVAFNVFKKQMGDNIQPFFANAINAEKELENYKQVMQNSDKVLANQQQFTQSEVERAKINKAYSSTYKNMSREEQIAFNKTASEYGDAVQRRDENKDKNQKTILGVAQFAGIELTDKDEDGNFTGAELHRKKEQEKIAKKAASLDSFKEGPLTFQNARGQAKNINYNEELKSIKTLEDNMEALPSIYGDTEEESKANLDAVRAYREAIEELIEAQKKLAEADKEVDKTKYRKNTDEKKIDAKKKQEAAKKDLKAAEAKVRSTSTKSPEELRAMQDKATKKVKKAKADNQNLEGTAAELRKSEEEVAGLQEKMDSISSEKMQKEFSQNISKMIGGVAALGFGFTSVTGIIDVWGDDTKSSGEKVMATFTALPAIIGAVKAAMDGLNATKEFGKVLSEGSFKSQFKEVALTKLHVKAKTEETVATTAEAGAEVVDSAAKDKNTNSTNVNTAATIANKIAKMGWMAIVVAAIAAVTALAVAIAVSLDNAYRADAIALEEAKKKREQANEALSATKKAYEDLKTSISDYKSARDAIEDLTEGTQDWRDALIEANDKVLELIKNYPELAKYIQNINGELKLDDNALEVIRQLEQNKLKESNIANLNANANVQRAQIENDKTEFARGLTRNSYMGVTATPTDKATINKALAAYKADENLFDKSLKEIAETIGVSNLGLVKALKENKDGIVQLNEKIAANTIAANTLGREAARGAFSDNATFNNSSFQNTLASIGARQTRTNSKQYQKELNKVVAQDDHKVREQYAKLMGWDGATIDDGKNEYTLKDGTKLTVDLTTAESVVAQNNILNSLESELPNINDELEKINESVKGLNIKPEDFDQILAQLFSGEEVDFSNLTEEQADVLYRTLETPDMEKGISELTGLTEDTVMRKLVDGMNTYEKSDGLTDEQRNVYGLNNTSKTLRSGISKVNDKLKETSLGSNDIFEVLSGYLEDADYSTIVETISSHWQELFTDSESFTDALIKGGMAEDKARETTNNLRESMSSLSTTVEGLIGNLQESYTKMDKFFNGKTDESTYTKKEIEDAGIPSSILEEYFSKEDRYGNRTLKSGYTKEDVRQAWERENELKSDYNVTANQNNIDNINRKLEFRKNGNVPGEVINPLAQKTADSTLLDELKEYREANKNSISFTLADYNAIEERINSGQGITRGDYKETYQNRNLYSIEAFTKIWDKYFEDSDANKRRKQQGQAAEQAGTVIDYLKEASNAGIYDYKSFADLEKKYKDFSILSDEDKSTFIEKLNAALESVKSNTPSEQDLENKKENAENSLQESTRSALMGSKTLEAFETKLALGAKDAVDEETQQEALNTLLNEQLVNAGLTREQYQLINKEIEKEGEGLNLDNVTLTEITLHTMQLEKGLTDINKGWQNNYKALKDSVKGTLEYKNALISIKDSMKEVFGQDVSVEFAEKYADEFNLMLQNGYDADLYERMIEDSARAAAEKANLVLGDVFDNFNPMEHALGETVSGEVNSKIAEMLRNTEGNEEEIKKIIALWKIVGINIKDINAETLEFSAIYEGIGDHLRTVTNSIAEQNKKTKGTLELLEDEVDRYHDVNIQLKFIEKELDRLGKTQEKIFGPQVFNNLNKQLGVLKQQRDVLLEKQKIQQQEQVELQQELSGYGITFQADGTMANYLAQAQEWEDQINALRTTSYNTQSDQDKQALTEAEKRYSKFKEKISRYDTLISDEMLDIEDQIAEIADMELDIEIKKISVKVEAAIEIKDVNTALEDFNMAMMDNPGIDKVAESIGRKIGFSISSETGELLNTSTLRQNLNALQEITQKYNDALKDPTADVAKLKDEMLNYYNAVIGDMEELKDLQRQIDKQYLAAMDETQAAFDRQKNIIESIGSSIEHTINVIKLTQGEGAYSAMASAYDARQTMDMETLTNATSQRNYWQDQMEKNKQYGIDSDEYKKAEEMFIAANQAWESAVTTTIEHLQEKYVNSINAIFENANNKLQNGLTSDYVDTEWDLMKKNADMYLDDVNRAYETRKLEAKYVDAINKSTSESAQKRINKLREEELEALREKDKLSQYDIDRANKKYDILLKEIALEEAQQNKSSMRLRRDSQGNYSYQFVADQDEVSKAQQDLEDAKNNLYNFDKEAYEKSLEDARQIWNAYQQAMAEAAKIDDPEERAKKEQLIQEQYIPLLEASVEKSEETKKNFKATATEEVKTLLGEEATAVGKVEEAVNKLSPAFISSAQAWVDAINKEDGGVKGVMDDLYASIEQENKDYIADMGEVETAAGGAFTTIASDVEIATSAVGKTKDEIDALTKKISDPKDGLIANVSKLKNAFKNAFEGLFGKDGTLKKEIDSALGAVTKTINEVNTAIINAEAAAKAASQIPPPKGSATTGDVNGTGIQGPPEEPPEKKKTYKEYFDKILGKNLTTDPDKYKSEIMSSSKLVERLLGSREKDTYDSIKSTSDQTKYWQQNVEPKLSGEITEKEAKEFFKMQDTIIKNTKYTRINIGGQLYYLTEKERKEIFGFATGGYTGDWAGTEGKLAMLHQKELVLNANDTENLLAAVSELRKTKLQLDSNYLQDKLEYMLQKISFATSASELNAKYSSLGGDLQQKVEISASFPNATNHSEIEEAFKNLTNTALQYAYSTDQ